MYTQMHTCMYRPMGKCEHATKALAGLQKLDADVFLGVKSLCASGFSGLRYIHLNLPTSHFKRTRLLQA